MKITFPEGVNVNSLLKSIRSHKGGANLDQIMLDIDYYDKKGVSQLFTKAKNEGYRFKIVNGIYTLDETNGKAYEDRQKKIDNLIESARQKTIPKHVEIR